MNMHGITIDKSKYIEAVSKNSKDAWKTRGFSQLPNYILADDRLGHADRLVYWALKLHNFKGKEYCYPSLQTISKKSHYVKNTVIKALKKLEELGYIRVDRQRRKKEKSNCYYLLGNPLL